MPAIVRVKRRIDIAPPTMRRKKGDRPPGGVVGAWWRRATLYNYLTDRSGNPDAYSWPPRRTTEVGQNDENRRINVCPLGGGSSLGTSRFTLGFRLCA
jgi:hypothetical protein